MSKLCAVCGSDNIHPTWPSKHTKEELEEFDDYEEHVYCHDCIDNSQALVHYIKNITKFAENTNTMIANFKLELKDLLEEIESSDEEIESSDETQFITMKDDYENCWCDIKN